MLKFIKITATAFVLVLFSVSVSAQQPSPSPARPEPEYISEKGFKNRIFEVKYRDVSNLATVLRPLGSGFKGATVWANSEFKTITVRDFPENLATIDEAIKRLDIPAAPRPNIELHIYALIASDSSTSEASAKVPAELKDVLTQLRTTLNYKNYELAATIVQRLTETQNSLQGNGTGEVSGGIPGALAMPMPYSYGVKSVSVVQNPTGAKTVQIYEFSFNAQTDKDRALVNTALNLRDGEKVVVGTATIRNRALIVVLAAKLLN